MMDQSKNDVTVEQETPKTAKPVEQQPKPEPTPAQRKLSAPSILLMSFQKRRINDMKIGGDLKEKDATEAIYKEIAPRSDIAKVQRSEVAHPISRKEIKETSHETSRQLSKLSSYFDERNKYKFGLNNDLTKVKYETPNEKLKKFLNSNKF